MTGEEGRSHASPVIRGRWPEGPEGESLNKTAY
jgi:hypothetical protein